MTAKQLRDLRSSRGHTIVVAALHAGVSPRTWIRWEQGHSPIDPARVEIYRQGGSVAGSRTKRSA